MTPRSVGGGSSNGGASNGGGTSDSGNVDAGPSENTDHYEAGLGSCVDYRFSTTLKGYASDGSSTPAPGYASVQDSCGMETENCMLYAMANCMSLEDINTFNNDPHNVWVVPGQLPRGWEEVALPTFGVACKYINVPAGCEGSSGDIEPVGCHYGSTCDGGTISLSCDGATCKCSGGSTASFNQGSTCANVIQGAQTLYAQCR